MSSQDFLRRAILYLREANRVGWRRIDADEIENLIYGRRVSINKQVISMALRKETIGTVVAIGVLTRFIPGRQKIDAEFWGMVLSGLLYWAHKIPVLKDIRAVTDIGWKYRGILKVALATFAILWIIDALTAGTLGFGGLRAIGEKYGIAFASEGVTGVFRQVVEDIKGAFRGFGFALPATEKKATIPTEAEMVIVPPEEEKLKEETPGIVTVETL